MDDYQRQTYLQHLGVDSYSPRWLLPGAAPSRACPLPPAGAASAAPVSAAPVLSPSPVAEAASTAAVEPVAAPVANPTEINPPATAPVADPPRQTAVAPVAAEVPRFALTVWRIGTELLVIDSREAQLALPTDRLLANIVAALGYRLPQLPKAQVLRWPVLENGAADQGEQEAREMVQAFLQAQAARQPLTHLLVMGETAARYVLDQSVPFVDILGTAMPVAPLSAAAIVVPSLAAMLQDPAQKAVTWRAVQPLRQH
ncbi:hypothetical protein FKG94_10180 [Exilibacterium tricleocarpae]|uniref:Uracil-DNA glycosylase-like domain-containing protein n=1 Tax=Exilibacterium tricleocarpae TaxID=2591008 RepID=A0A545TS41_9GAMM|nr:hypothetical protein [Exilibacterium tricleocarpae]TQV80032.1 hypothetical protein FKG94_10180 [Exilibacterium tricleocarpae]